MAANLPAQQLPLFEASNRAPADFVSLHARDRAGNGAGEEEIKILLDELVERTQAVKVFVTKNLCTGAFRKYQRKSNCLDGGLSKR